MKKSDEEKTELEKKLEAEVAAEEAESTEASDETVESTPEQPAIDVETVMRERAALADQLLRMRAEFDNYRKRMARDADRVRQQAAESLIRDLLPVVDNLELAMKHRDGGPDALAEGVGMVLRQFHDVLTRNGVEPIRSAGEAFNPEVHEAVTQREHDEVPAHSVIEEYQKGYKLGQLVLRPAKVVVSTGAAGSGETAEETSAAESEA
ncbi:MAG: nucleotide exchange factor GrpE [Candidatus Hydrogenedentes bacterium]|nr:nucleotide exchange factor GrpE [Candidatus Hydrogenedentota bacterium]